MQPTTTSPTAQDDRAAPSASLAEVAGRLRPLLGGTAVPMYAVGAIATHGPARWVLAVLGTVMLVAAVSIPSREPRRHEAPVTILMSVAFIVLWVWLNPVGEVLLGMGLAVNMVYMALMLPRPYAEIGIGAVAATMAALQLRLGAGGMMLQTVGEIATALLLGVLLLGIRVTTERKVNERTQSLADANAQLERLSRTDPLTGLANRRRLQDVLAGTWESAEATGRPISAIMIDIDHFKQYNDHFGHLGGDECLRLIAMTVASSVRGADTVARYGGEEIAVILPDADLDCARRTAERIREAIAALEAPHPASSTGYLTVSLGVASASPAKDGEARQARSDTLLERADHCLYDAKHGGRNRVAA